VTVCDDSSLNLWRLDVKDGQSQLELVKSISAESRSALIGVVNSPPRRGYATAWCRLSVCLSVCQQDYYWYCNSCDSVSLKLAVMIGPIRRKNWKTFSGYPVVDTDCGSLFCFRHHCGIADCKRFISFSHTVTG